MATSEQVRQRIEEFARQLTEELGEVDEADGVCWLDAVENQAIEIGDAIAAALIQQTTVQPPHGDDSLCPQCGKSGCYQGTRQRELIGRRGPTTIAEPEYYCPCCRKAFFPADQSHRR